LFNNKIPRILLFVTAIIMYASSVWIGSYNKAYSIAVFSANYIVLPFLLFVLVVASLCVKFKKYKLKRFLK